MREPQLIHRARRLVAHVSRFVEVQELDASAVSLEIDRSQLGARNLEQSIDGNARDIEFRTFLEAQAISVEDQ